MGGTPMRALLCGLLAAGLTYGAAPPARPGPEQVKLLRERDAHWAAAWKAGNAGKPAEAIAALEKALAAQLRVHGRWHSATARIAERLCDDHCNREEWDKGARYQRLVIEA